MFVKPNRMRRDVVLKQLYFLTSAPLSPNLRAIFATRCFLFFVFSSWTLASPSRGNEDEKMAITNIEGRSKHKWVLVIHGGAGAATLLTEEREASLLAGLTAALGVGSQKLRDGGTALDAVEATVRVLEDDSMFNAGRGAKMTLDGKFELDASMMCGRTLSAGAVAGVRSVANPITLAREVMTHTEHVLLCSEGADAFARSRGIPAVGQDYFFDQRAFDSNNANRVKKGLPPLLNPAKEFSRGTVGAVALDRHGDLAAATSTGGVTGKMAGRLGDSPIIGAGTYARNDAGAISCTGQGEEFIRHAAAFQSIMLVRYSDQTLQKAIDTVLQKEITGGTGGMIGVTPDGQIVFSFTTEIMSRGYATSDGEMKAMIREAR